jgi:hypothetical protein
LPAQVEPGQQGVPGSPQREQTCELTLQVVFAPVQTLPAQQGSPALPQETHVLLVVLQRVPPAVHMRPGQQGWPAPPQVPQDPAVQVPGTAPPQLAPPATHEQPTQQPPPMQELPGQHALPGMPHAPPASPPPVPPVEPASVMMETSGPPSFAGEAPPSPGKASVPVMLELEQARARTAKIRAGKRCWFKGSSARAQHRHNPGRCATNLVLARQADCVDDGTLPTSKGSRACGSGSVGRRRWESRCSW